MSDPNTPKFSEDDLSAIGNMLTDVLDDFLEKLGEALPSQDPRLFNPEHVFNSNQGNWENNPDYVRAWVRFDDLGGGAMELPAGSVDWQPDIHWERHANGLCWEVEPRRLSDRRMKELQAQYMRDRSAHLAQVVSK